MCVLPGPGRPAALGEAAAANAGIAMLTADVESEHRFVSDILFVVTFSFSNQLESKM